MNNITIPEIADILRQNDDFILLSHTGPDGDTVGSVCGLACILEAMGKRVRCVCDKPIPEYISFIAGERYISDTDPDGAYIISIDVASPQQLGSLADKFASIVDLRIDHHDTGTEFGKFNYCEGNAGACAEIIYLIAKELGIMTSDCAGALYLGMSTDTGSFKYSCTTARTHRIVAELIEAGAPTEDINDRLYENMTLDSLKANALFLDNMELFENGRILLVCVSIADRENRGLADDQLEGISSLARKISGVSLGISLREKSDGVYKVSMRSDKHINSAALCQIFGGGGHIRAAGATINAPSLEEARAILVSVLEENAVFEDTDND